ncbi:MAG: 2-C-methyl-D-erythritol 4-phosphate cytidylyltransferase [Brevinematales bacterium]|nr:2-C-methyl-D-erythritol 4-phosphate cytidylyltransferase [Brevinematales bacterium]
MPESKLKVAGIILAGGTGSRFGAGNPKQFAELCGKRVIEYSIEKFLNVVDSLIIVSHIDWLDYVGFEIINERNIRAVAGGDTRQLSVYNGLCALEREMPDIVAIHDAARPLFSPALLKKCIDAAAETGAATAAVRSHDTLARVMDGAILNYTDRESTVKIQTPQAFRYGDLYVAHSGAKLHDKTDYTDDTQAVFATGLPVRIVEGDDTNIKITTLPDLKIAEAILSMAE